MSRPPLNLIIRGHVRSSFGDERLKGLVSGMLDRFDAKIYVQTWNVLQSNLSWRKVESIEEEVTEDRIRDYFGTESVKSIRILDDSKIVHHGNTTGNIGRTPCPVLAWKNMYYGKFVASKSVLEREGPDGVTLQMRFDILSNPFSPPEAELIEFVERDYELLEKRLVGDERLRFLRMRCFMGVDNTYMATAGDMHRFISYMYYDMDRILHFHRRTIHQEHIAFHERRSFFEWSVPGDPVHGPASDMWA